jgi:hypothetical protein
MDPGVVGEVFRPCLDPAGVIWCSSAEATVSFADGAIVIGR